MWRSMTNQSELVTEAAINAAIKARWFYANKVLFTSGSISLDDSTRIQLTAAAPLIAAQALRLAAQMVEPGKVRPAAAISSFRYGDLMRLADEWEGKANGS